MSAKALTRLQMEILEFERATWSRHALGRRDDAILKRFGHTAIRHTQIVLHLIDQPAALEYDPVLVRQLRDRRDATAARHARGSW